MKSLICLALCSAMSFSQTSIHSFWHKGYQRDYIVFLPHNYDSLTNVPVVLVLHAYSITAQNEMDATAMNTVADTAGFIAVYPNAVETHWNSGIGDDPGWPTPNVDDVGFISALIDTLYANYRINLRRVYTCGMSNGGFMSYKLACQLSSRIGAAASVAGAVANSTAASCVPANETPILLMHGTLDPLVPYSGTPYWLSAEHGLQHWLALNGCTGPPDTVLLPDVDTTDGCTVQKVSYGGCSGNSQMVFYRILNGGHQWPGSTVTLPPFFGNKNRDINASVEIWNFVKNFTRTPTSVRGDEGELPGRPWLIQNYPNPFNPVTNFQFSIVNRQLTILRVFDVLGREVATPLNEVKQPGTYTVEWDASGVASGVYFYRLQSGQFSAVQKMLLTR